MAKKKDKQENIFLNIALNIIIPTVILTKFSGEDHLGVQNGIIVALAFPILYGIYDLITAGRFNLFSVLGVVSILLTGTISLLKLDAQYIAIKEAAIPAIFGLVALGSLYTRFPLVKTLLYNDKIIQVNKVDEALQQHQNKPEFEKALKFANYLVAGSFFLSSALNYGLAKYILVSPPGTEAFNAELGKMTALSFPVIMVPSMIVLISAMFFLFRSITRLTGLSLEEIFNDPDQSKQQ